MTRRKTDAEFRKEVKALVGDEYLPLDKYTTAKAKMRLQHQKCHCTFYMSPDNFLQGRRCPKCMKLKASAEEALSDRQFKYKLVMRCGTEYVPLQEYKTSHHKMLFEHLICGRVFKMRPNAILRGSGCPLCAKEKLAEKYRLKDFKQRVKARWGNQYQVIGKYVNNKTLIKVKHLPCNKIYYILAGNLLKNTQCRYCYGNQMYDTRGWWDQFSNTIKSRFKLLSNYRGNKQKVKILCVSCNNKFMKTAQAFRISPTCPYCDNTGKMNTSIFEFKVAQQTSNYVVIGNYVGTNKKIKMKHLICQTTFWTTPNNFLSGRRCPYCSKRISKGERLIVQYLRSKRMNFKYQYCLQGCKDKNMLPFDFAVFNSDGSLNCLVEYQGEQHFYNPFTYGNQWFSKESVLRTQKHDAMKLQYCKEHGIRLIRINHPQTDSKSNSIEFIERLVNRTLNKELKVS